MKRLDRGQRRIPRRYVTHTHPSNHGAANRAGSAQSRQPRLSPPSPSSSGMQSLGKTDRWPPSPFLMKQTRTSASCRCTGRAHHLLICSPTLFFSACFLVLEEREHRSLHVCGAVATTRSLSRPPAPIDSHALAVSKAAVVASSWLVAKAIVLVSSIDERGCSKQNFWLSAQGALQHETHKSGQDDFGCCRRLGVR